MNCYQELEISKEGIYYVRLCIHYTRFTVICKINKLLVENLRIGRQMPTRISQQASHKWSHSLSHVGKNFVIHMADRKRDF